MKKSTIKVLLLSPQYDDKSVPPFGVAYLAGFLRDQSTIELTVINSDEHSFRKIEKIVCNNDYDVFATGGLITCLKFCQHMFQLSAATMPDAKRIVGGPLTVLDHNLLFKNMPIDVAVLGEGEETFSELLEVLHQEGNFGSVKGIMYREKDNCIKVTEPRPPIDISIRDLDPDWSFVDMERYITFPDTRGFFFNRYDSSRAYRVGYIMAGRGCPYRCHFCGSPLGRFRRRPNKNIINEIKWWRDKYSVNHIRFINETLFMRPSEIKPFCQMMIDEKLKMRWSCSLRVDCIDRESLELMKEAGCDYIIYGVESGSNPILKRMNKHTTVEQNRAAIRLTRGAGIYPDVAVMFGYCDETLEDIKKTVNLMLEGNDLPESLAVTTAMPGTELYKELISKGLIADEFEYIEKMCNEMSKGAISGYRKPILNPTKIPDNIYWSSILAEKRRLYTEHFITNRAVVSSCKYFNNGICLIASCPHCGFSFNVNVSLENLSIEKHFCKQCLRYIWVDSYMIPEFREHFDKVGRFLQNVQRDGKYLVLYIPASAANAFRLFEIDPWNLIWSNVSAIISDIDEFFYFKVVRPKDAQNLAPSPVLIMDMDFLNVYKRLIRMGFSGDEMITILPRIPIRNFYQIKRRFLFIAWYYCPTVFKPLAKRTFQKLKGVLERK